MKAKKSHLVYQFKIALNEIEPPIWRRIQVPSEYSFWDLHVALQDAMGWLDCHLHGFFFRQKHKRGMTEIGIPGEEFEGQVVLPGWEIPITAHFAEPGQTMRYEYDFGDGWEHEVLLEGILLKEKGVKYPRCLEGARACPPEDCGGVTGYFNLLDILKDPRHAEHEDTVTWLKGHLKNYYPFDPDGFEAAAVHFDSPRRRWKIAFSER
jgi:hypothetical protein